MLTINVTGIDAVTRQLANLYKDLEDKVLQASINKTADKARAEINRAIPEQFAVKASEVRNAVEIYRARGGKLSATISIFGSATKRGRSMNMIHFVAAAYLSGAGVFKVRSGAVGIKKKDIKALKRQLGFQIKKGTGLKSIAGAFIGNKGRTVFIRTGSKRLPIKPVQVIGFSQMFNTKNISNRVMNKIRNDLPEEVSRAIKMKLATLGSAR